MARQERALIEAIALEPWGETTMRQLPKLDIGIYPRSITCIIGSRSDILSTYLRALGAVDSSRSGELFLFGRPLSVIDRQKWRRLRRRIGFVTRQAPLLSVLNGLENVLLPALYHKLFPRKEAEQRARELIARLHCTANLNLLPAYLSDLERIQLAIARTVILDPVVLFLEEPYHELDVRDHEKINEFLLDWAQQRTLVMSTRNLHFVRNHATRIVFPGSHSIYYFDSWHQLTESNAEEVEEYLHHYRELHEL
jgi:ABC-type polar amino acid transport system ATPase subunit